MLVSVNAQEGIYALLIDLKTQSIRTHRGEFWQDTLIEEHLRIKATGVCGLLNTYSGTQSGKSLGGKLANKENQFPHNVLGKTLKMGRYYLDTTLYISNIYSKMYCFIGTPYKNLN